jgi:hypothetical protein
MIRYALACEQAHEFETWFPSADGYDAQVARGLVRCPMCGSGKVEKQIMAPAIGRKDRAAAPVPVPLPGPQPGSPEPPAPQPVALLSEKAQAFRAMLNAFREHVTKNSDYVGPRFVDEARKMHYGETEHRSIYGEANAADAAALLEEGIEVHPLPIAPDDRN